MIQAWQSFVSMLAAVILAICGAAQPDDMARLANTQWVDEDGWVYSFNEDATQFACYDTAFIYGRMSTGEYRQASITQNAELIYRLDDRSFGFSMDGADLLLHCYHDQELVHSQRFTPYVAETTQN